MRHDPVQEVQALLDEGRAHLDAGRRRKAEACFRSAAGIDPENPYALNNWALCRYLQKDYLRVLRILEPIRSCPDPLPYTHALASLALTRLGRAAEARQALQRAIEDFDRGLAARRKARLIDPAFIEYTTMIKQAAGALGDHMLVLNLHSRWPGRELPAGAFAAGVAAFNLGLFQEAIGYWSRIRHAEWRQVAEAFARVAEVADGGLIPPFVLEYEEDGDLKPIPRDEETAKAMTARGTVRMRFLAAIFAPETPNPAQLTAALIGATGEWGIELGHRMLNADAVPMNIKMGAAQALVQAGVFPPDQPIPVHHQGRRTEIRLRNLAVTVRPNEEVEALVARAERLVKAGQTEEALRLLSDLRQKSAASPRLMLLEAGLLLQRRELDEAQVLLEALEKIAPGNPEVMISLGLLWLERGDVDRALHYALSVDPEKASPQMQSFLANLHHLIRAYTAFQDFFDPAASAEAWREEIEERPIKPEVTLAAALRQIPVQWLNATAAVYQVAPVRLRKEREKVVAAALQDPEQVRRALAAEEPPVRAALAFLLEKGGWAKLQVLTRRFGSIEGDGFFWDEEPPKSTIGRLRLLGLAYVGRARVDGRNHKIAVVPAELRPMLDEVLKASAPGTGGR